MTKDMKNALLNNTFKNSMQNIINIKENKRRVRYQNRSQQKNTNPRNSFQMKLF